MHLFLVAWHLLLKANLETECRQVVRPMQPLREPLRKLLREPLDPPGEQPESQELRELRGHTTSNKKLL